MVVKMHTSELLVLEEDNRYFYGFFVIVLFIVGIWNLIDMLSQGTFDLFHIGILVVVFVFLITFLSESWKKVIRIDKKRGTIDVVINLWSIVRNESYPLIDASYIGIKNVLEGTDWQIRSLLKSSGHPITRITIYFKDNRSLVVNSRGMSFTNFGEIGQKENDLANVISTFINIPVQNG